MSYVLSIFEDKIVYSYDNGWLSYVPNRSDNSLETLKPGYGYWVK